MRCSPGLDKTTQKRWHLLLKTTWEETSAAFGAHRHDPTLPRAGLIVEERQIGAGGQIMASIWVERMALRSGLNSEMRRTVGGREQNRAEQWVIEPITGKTSFCYVSFYLEQKREIVPPNLVANVRTQSSLELSYGRS